MVLDVGVSFHAQIYKRDEKFVETTLLEYEVDDPITERLPEKAKKDSTLGTDIVAS